jgi:hypothetical protein
MAGPRGWAGCLLVLESEQEWLVPGDGEDCSGRTPQFGWRGTGAIEMLVAGPAPDFRTSGWLRGAAVAVGRPYEDAGISACE